MSSLAASAAAAARAAAERAFAKKESGAAALPTLAFDEGTHDTGSSSVSMLMHTIKGQASKEDDLLTVTYMLSDSFYPTGALFVQKENLNQDLVTFPSLQEAQLGSSLCLLRQKNQEGLIMYGAGEFDDYGGLAR